MKLTDFKSGDYIRLKNGRVFGKEAIVLVEPKFGDTPELSSSIPCAVKYSDVDEWVPCWLLFSRVSGLWGNAFDSTRPPLPKPRSSGKTMLIRIKESVAAMGDMKGRVTISISRAQWGKLAHELGVVLRPDKTVEIPIEDNRIVEVCMMP